MFQCSCKEALNRNKFSAIESIMSAVVKIISSTQCSKVMTYFKGLFPLLCRVLVGHPNGLTLKSAHGLFCFRIKGLFSKDLNCIDLICIVHWRAISVYSEWMIPMFHSYYLLLGFDVYYLLLVSLKLGMHQNFSIWEWSKQHFTYCVGVF